MGGTSIGDLAGPGSSLGGWDSWVAHYGVGGIQDWIRQFGTSGADVCKTMCSDWRGGGYFSGWTNGDFGGPSLGGWDIVLARFDGLGASPYCLASPNSTGTSAVLGASRVSAIQANDLT